MERALELMVAIGYMKKIQCMANGQIDAINTRGDINENTVVKKIRVSTD